MARSMDFEAVVEVRGSHHKKPHTRCSRIGRGGAVALVMKWLLWVSFTHKQICRQGWRSCLSSCETTRFLPIFSKTSNLQHYSAPLFVYDLHHVCISKHQTGAAGQLSINMKQMLSSDQLQDGETKPFLFRKPALSGTSKSCCCCAAVCLLPTPSHSLTYFYLFLAETLITLNKEGILEYLSKDLKLKERTKEKLGFLSKLGMKELNTLGDKLVYIQKVAAVHDQSNTEKWQNFAQCLDRDHTVDSLEARTLAELKHIIIEYNQKYFMKLGKKKGQGKAKTLDDWEQSLSSRKMPKKPRTITQAPWLPTLAKLSD